MRSPPILKLPGEPVGRLSRERALDLFGRADAAYGAFVDAVLDQRRMRGVDPARYTSSQMEGQRLIDEAAGALTAYKARVRRAYQLGAGSSSRQPNPRRRNPEYVRVRNDWPAEGLYILQDAARDYAHARVGAWASSETLPDAVDRVMAQLDDVYRSGDAASSWEARYESGELDKEVRAILTEYTQHTPGIKLANPRAYTSRSVRAPIVGRVYKVGKERVRVTDLLDGAVEVESLDTVNAGFIRLADWHKHARPAPARRRRS